MTARQFLAAGLVAGLAAATKYNAVLRADYEHAASIRRKFDFASDPDSVAKFHQPITQTYQSILNEAVEVLPDRAAAQAWAKYIAENYTPDQLDKNWWNHSVIDKVPEGEEAGELWDHVKSLARQQSFFELKRSRPAPPHH